LSKWPQEARTVTEGLKAGISPSPDVNGPAAEAPEAPEVSSIALKMT